MYVEREIIYQAVFDMFSSFANFNTKSRKLEHWSKVNAADFPCLYMCQVDETPFNQVRGVQKWILKAELWVYLDAGNDPTVIPATALNGLLDKIDAALKPTPTGWNTLGGKVEAVRIAGTIATDEGKLGTKSIAVIPVEIITH